MKYFCTKIKEKKIILYLLAFSIPILIAIIGFYTCLRFQSTGNLVPTYGDLQAQYINLFTYLQNALKGDASFIYSFSKGLGGNMASTIAYYLLSPLNLLIVFVSQSNIPFMILGIIILKMGLAGLCMYIFLSYTFKMKSIKLVLFSTCYAASAYVVNFYFCVMWLDAIYMAPLIFLGIKRLVEGKSSFMYILCLTLSIMMNYYMGYMLCIFCCIYFLYEIIMQGKYKNKKDFFSLFLRFALSSILGGVISMVVLIPMLVDLNGTARALGNYQGGATLSTVGNVYDYWQLIYRTLIGSYSAADILKYQSINLYFGLICLPLIYFYFVNKNIPKKEKMFSFGMIVFFILSYSIKYINYIWHGFAFPNGLNYRFMFLFMFYFIYMACRSFLCIDAIKTKHYYIFGFVYMLLMNGMFIYSTYIDNLVPMYISIGLIFLYLFILKYLGNTKNSEKNRKDFMVLVLLLVIGELVFNVYYSLHSYFGTTTKEYSDYIEIYGNNIDKYKSGSDDFYRMNQQDYFTSNVGLLFNYNGIESFLSTNNVSSLNFLKLNGYFANEISSIVSANDHILMDSILGVKYYLTKSSCGTGYEQIDSFKYSAMSGYLYGLTQADVHICKNSHSLSVGYMVDSDWDSYGSDVQNVSYLEVSQSIVNSMLGSSRTYYSLIDIKDQESYQYKVIMPSDGSRVYLSIMYYDSPDTLNIYVNDSPVESSKYYHSSIFALNNEYPGEEVTIKLEAKYGDEVKDEEKRLGVVYFYKENIDEIYASLEELNQYSFDVERVTATSIKGKVVSTKDKPILLFTIPYEKGWTVYVDGVETSYERLYDAFIGISLKEGEHEVELVYQTPGIKTGLLVCSIGIILTGVYLSFEHKKQKKVK